MRIVGYHHVQLAMPAVEVVTDVQLEGRRRFYVVDPFGNRLELIE